MLVDTEFPVKWVTYYIPFGVHAYTFETQSSYIKSPLLKLYIENFKHFLEHCCSEFKCSDHCLS